MTVDARRARKTDLALEVRAAVQRLAQRLGGEVTRKLEARGISRAQFELLRHIDAHPDGTQQELARNVGVTRGNVSQLLSKLEAEGLVLRAAMGTRKHLRVSRRGERFLESVLPSETALLAQRFAPLSKTDLETLLALLTKLEG
jgi:DNA-binding MarR family transcriptional regulator